MASTTPLIATVDPAETTLIDYTDLITPALSATSWRTDVFTPTPGIANTGVDAGFYALTTLSGRAFFDTDGDDLDAADPDAEPGMRAVEVRLLRAADSAVVTTTLTSATGAYALADVAPGDYLLEFVNPVTATFELITGTTAVTTTSPLASDVEAVSPAGAGRTGTISVTSGESLDEIDAGFRGLGDVAGRVFLDADGSNTQTALDSSLAGATAALTVTADLPNLAAIYSAVVSPTNTVAGDPNYSFAGLPLGAGVTYTLAISPPATLPAERPYLSSDPDVGDDALDSDGPVIVVTDPTTASLDFDQGFFQEARITARVFEELVGAPDNSFAAGDEGIGGATVRLEAITGTLALSETTVDATGLVTFTARPGSYRLRLDESTLPAGLQPSPGYSNPITLTENPLLSGEDSNTDGAGNNSFGFFRTGTISGTVFFDRDLDQRRAGEPGVGGVEVTLDDGTTAVTTTTSASGVYSFTGLVSGTYSLSFANPGPGNLAFVTGGDSLVDANGAIASVTVGRGADVGGQDAGLVGRSSVGGLAFVDADADGRSDGPPDRGLPGVTVTLTMDVTLPGLTTQITRTAVTTATTGISGTYSFAGLPGDPDGAGGDSTAAYTLTFTAPVATPPWQVTDPDQGDDDGDSDGAAQLRSQTLAPATTDERDQGYFQDVTITARVFEERAGAADNSFAAGDLGLAGVAVGLEQIGGTPTVTPTQTTGETGLVTFTVRPGSYRLRLDEAAVPEGLNPSPGWANPVTITTALGDGLILSGESSLAGEPAGANSFGYFRTGTISGTVFFDRDLDGLKSAEPGLANVEVALRLGASVVDTTTTSPTGAYTFTDVVSGSYTLVFTNPDPGNFAFFTGGDSDLATAGAIATSTIDLGPVPFGASRGDNDAGLRGLAAVGGLAFEDADADGRSDGPDDRPLAGVTVTLTLDVGLPDLATQITRTATTTATGVYSFTGLPGGGTSAYTLTFQAPDGTWLLTDPDQGDDDGDSDGAAQLADQPLAPGQQVARDQGYFQNVTITARVFDELVAVNNSFEAGEAGIAGVDISLDTAPPDSETTGLTGVVTFTVRPGSYTLTSATPAGFTPSPANTGTLAMTATSGLKLTADFGYFRAGSLAGTAWFDSSRDGRLDAGEPGMEGVTVTLQASGGGPDLGQGVTDATGAYAITGILPSGVGAAPAGYRLCFAATADFTPTVRAGATGDDDTNDANPDGCTDAFTMEGSGASLTTVDAGFLGLNRIGDLVWNDLDGDGVQDAGESGIAGAVVTLAISTTGTINSGDPTVVMTATSTASADLGANYAVTGAPPAAGFRVVGVTPPAGFALGPTNVLTATEATDSDAVGDSFGAVPPDNLDVDFGLVSLTTVGDLAWLDVNGNGRLDAGEPGVPGVGVELLRGGAVISATTTAAGAQAGRYAFADLAPGTYSLRFVPQAGYVFTNDGAGAIATDGDNDARADGTTTEFTLTGGQQLLSVDAGLRGTGAIGGLVWVDTNRNNVRDPAETGRLEGVRVTLTLTPTFAAQPLVRATATAADGGYSFADLPEGRATVSFAQPTGFFPVAPNVGPEATDSDGPVARLDLAPGGQVANVDMGYREQGLFVYLPVVQGRVERAELVGSVSVTRASNVAYTPVQIAVTVTNRGDGPASNFWVDLYINPSRRPAVNDRWNDICGTTATPCQGLAWFYTGTLAPGQSVSLVSTATSDTSPTGFVRAASTWSGTFFNGTSVLYALVDSWNRDETGAVRDPEGAVREQDETNNLTEQAVVVTPGTPPIELQAAPGAAPLDRATLRR
ncbi:MAG TPA: SdrD B-like domain-containing protein [Chloroflexaceae bacterium]|nr:SdrD B-like domain-containing protein [Chloroflexaceae bacterium]